MTHHVANTPRLRRLACILSLGLAIAASASLLACSSSGDSDDGGEQIISALRIIVTAAVPVRGVQIDLRHGSGITVTDVSTGSSWAGGTCQENVTSGRVQAGCASNSDIATPFTAWTLAVRHSSTIDPADAVTALACVVSDSNGQAVAATCIAD